MRQQHRMVIVAGLCLTSGRKRNHSEPMRASAAFSSRWRATAPMAGMGREWRVDWPIDACKAERNGLADVRLRVMRRRKVPALGGHGRQRRQSKEGPTAGSHTSPTRRCLHECCEETTGRLVRRHQALRVELDSDEPVVLLTLDALDDAVRRPRGSPKPAAELADRLVVVAVDREVGSAEKLGKA